MAARGHINKEQTFPQFTDELSGYLTEASQDPKFRTAYEDAHQSHRIIDSLVKCRKALRLSQTDVAKRMDVRQPTISGFETEHSDPRLSTLQRYARAVEGRLVIRLELPATCDWVSQTRVSAYRPAESVRVEAASAAVSNSGIVRDWKIQPAMIPAA